MGWIECYQSVKSRENWKHLPSEIAAKVVFHKSKWIMEKKTSQKKCFKWPKCLSALSTGNKDLHNNDIKWLVRADKKFKKI